MSRKRKRPSRRPGAQRQAVGTARASEPFRLTLEEWARDASISVAELREHIEVLTDKGWIIRLAPEVWMLTVPEKVTVE